MAPTLVALKGHPGVGKSTLARALACTLRTAKGLTSCVVAKDDFREAADDAALAAGLPPPPWLNAAANDAASRAACTALACGGVDVVVVDTTLSCGEGFDRLCRRAAAAGAGRVVVLEVVLEGGEDDDGGRETEWAARLAGRPAHKPADVAAVRDLIAGYGGRDGWAAERAGGGGDGGGGCTSGGHAVGPAAPLPLACVCGEDSSGRTTDGTYVRVDTGAGVGPDALAAAVVQRFFP